MRRVLYLAGCAAALGMWALMPAHVAAQTAEMPGQVLAVDRSKGNCLACHAMAGGGVPSNVGPELAGIKARFADRAELVAIVTNEEARNPQTVMPAFGRNFILNKQEIELIVDYLYTL